MPIGLGSQYPIATEKTTQGRAKNNAIIISMGAGKPLGYYARFVLAPNQNRSVMDVASKHQNDALPWVLRYPVSS